MTQQTTSSFCCSNMLRYYKIIRLTFSNTWKEKYKTALYSVSHSLPSWLAGGPLLRVARIRRTTDTFLFFSHTTNVLLFKSRCNIFIGVRIIKELPGEVASGTPCICIFKCYWMLTWWWPCKVETCCYIKKCQWFDMLAVLLYLLTVLKRTQLDA